jgi:signal transduction histidine kinase
MKTPLSSILGTVEILENENFIKKKGLQFLTILKENTERLKKLTERILKLSEIESVRNSLKEIVDLTKLGEEVVKKFENQFKEKGLEFTYEIQENTKIRGNYFLLEDVLINLLENAMKYTESGRVSLKIFKDEKYAYIEVEDTGKGIREENIDKIFEPFYREDRSRNENVKGTGLGLTITKRIVDMHSGEIKVESKPGAGTKFTLKFPKVD